MYHYFFLYRYIITLCSLLLAYANINNLNGISTIMILTIAATRYSETTKLKILTIFKQ